MAQVSNQTMQEPAPYKVYGTNEPYSGLTVEVGGFLYTTVGGALEGNSLQLTANVQPQQTQPVLPNRNGNNVPPPIGTGMTPPNPGVGGNTGAGNNQVGGSPSNNNQAPDTQTGGGGGMY